MKIKYNIQMHLQDIPGWLLITRSAVIVLSILIILTCILALILFCQHQDRWWNLYGYKALPRYRFHLSFLADALPKIFLLTFTFFLGDNIIGLIYTIRGRDDYQIYLIWLLLQSLILSIAFLMLPSVSVIM